MMKGNKNKEVYVGSTSKEPKERVNEHNKGANEWTKRNKPFTLVYYESYLCNQDARRRELFYKTGLGRQIRDAILNFVESKKIVP